MRIAAAALTLVALAPTVTGCAARRAFQERVAAKKQAQRAISPVTPAATTIMAAPGETVRLTNLKALPPPDGTPAPAPVAAARSTTSQVARGGTVTGATVPSGMQYLYGSGEAAAASLQAYLGLSDWMVAKATARRIGDKVDSVVLAPGATLASPRFLSCGNLPLAVVLDVDETSLLNLGYEADDSQRGTGYDAKRWDAWEKTGADAVAAVPGALEARAVASSVGVTFVFNSNRAAANAVQTAAALTKAGLGPVQHGSTLWLQGDVGGGSGKDARRAAIAARYCVIAMVGDQLGDFSDQFNTLGETPQGRRALASAKALKTIWGHGWFVLPNPVYGTALKGGLDAVFPADKRWTPPAANDTLKEAK